MHRLLICCVVLVTILARDAVAASQTGKAEDGRKVILHEDGTWTYAAEEYEQKYLATIQSGYLNDYPGATIGDAFEEYFKLPEWRFAEEPDSEKKAIVFSGRLRRAQSFKTAKGMSRLFVENAPVKVEFSILGPNSFEVNYAEVGVESGDRWSSKKVRSDLLLNTVYGK